MELHTRSLLSFRASYAQKRRATYHLGSQTPFSPTLERPYFYCRDCKSGIYPIDHALELAHEAYQYDMQEMMLRMGIESPYAISASLFKDLTGLSPSNHCLHDTLNRIGTLAPIEEVIPSAEEIRRRIEAVEAPEDGLPVLVVASDGAHAPTRP